MKKHTTEGTKSKRQMHKPPEGPLTVGIDLGDRSSSYCILNQVGEVLRASTVATTKKDLDRVFRALPRSRVALEAGTHSPWVSRQLQALGHEAIVANPRRVRLISSSSRKNDRLDAETLARLARVDPRMLFPIQHRGETGQADLTTVRARAALVEARTMLINTARGLAKSYGARLQTCDARYVNEELAQELPPALQAALRPLLEEIGRLSASIQEYDQAIARLAKERYPETMLLTAVCGVGTLIALTYVLTIEDPQRFRRSREVGCYLGLRPKRKQSGGKDPELGISKEGDAYLRKLLVQAAHVILGRHGADSDLRRFGQRLAGREGKGAKKKARVAVARKLAVLLHHLWTSGEVYEPVREKPALARAA
jgi:transposase